MILVALAPFVFLILSLIGLYFLYSGFGDLHGSTRFGRLRIVWEGKFGRIDLDSPCPACGHRGCELAFNKETKKVMRACKTCGCVITQPPVLPSLFEDKK